MKTKTTHLPPQSHIEFRTADNNRDWAVLWIHWQSLPSALFPWCCKCAACLGHDIWRKQNAITMCRRRNSHPWIIDFWCSDQHPHRYCMMSTKIHDNVLQNDLKRRLKLGWFDTKDISRKRHHSLLTKSQTLSKSIGPVIPFNLAKNCSMSVWMISS